jgi:hypothetical protein
MKAQANSRETEVSNQRANHAAGGILRCFSDLYDTVFEGRQTLLHAGALAFDLADRF